MKSKKNLLDQLKPLSYFDKHSIYQLGTQLGLKDSTIKTYISRFLRSKDVFQLKNGLYVSAYFFGKNRNSNPYLFYLANIIRQPSYISSWAALQYYGLTTEVIYAITSVTTKVTRNVQTKAGDFSYQSIDKNRFSDFVLVREEFDFYIATPAKALFDLLYFRTRQFRGMSFDEVKTLIEKLRIDIEEMEDSEQEKFYSMIKDILK